MTEDEVRKIRLEVAQSVLALLREQGAGPGAIKAVQEVIADLKAGR